MSRLSILFCENPLVSGRVDEDYEDEFRAAKQNGFGILLVNYEDLGQSDRFQQALKRIPQSEEWTMLIYRGWMLTPKQYADLYAALLLKNYRLINTLEAYRNCHYLPESLKFIAAHTPLTVFEKFSDENSLERLLEKTAVFGEKAVILKDYVKSEKHDWEKACFVENASDKSKLVQSIRELLRLRGEYLNEGIVVREFVALKELAIHSKSGMPLTEEYRLFFCKQKLLAITDYWEEGEYNSGKPDTAVFEEIAKGIESHFFSMDIARQTNGEFIIIELGDGQVAGLPDKLDRAVFYRSLKEILSQT